MAAPTKFLNIDGHNIKSADSAMFLTEEARTTAMASYPPWLAGS